MKTLFKAAVVPKILLHSLKKGFSCQWNIYTWRLPWAGPRDLKNAGNSLVVKNFGSDFDHISFITKSLFFVRSQDEKSYFIFRWRCSLILQNWAIISNKLWRHMACKNCFILRITIWTEPKAAYRLHKFQSVGQQRLPPIGQTFP
jgi:hypothetical protein